jgi:hypothetical protein
VTEPGNELHLVLDKSAVLAFLAGSVEVGEAIALLLEESRPAEFGVHLTTVAEADFQRFREADHGAVGVSLLPMLTGHVAFRALALMRDDLDGLVELTHRLRSVEMAAALVSATEFDALVLTAHPDHYVDADGEPHERVIGI